MSQNTLYSFEKIYDKYSALLYGVALQISPTTAVAEQILINTFKKAHQQNILNKNYPQLLIILIKLTIKTANEACNPDDLINKFRLKQFEKMPILNQFLCEEISIENYCIQNNLTQKEVVDSICKDFRLLKNYKAAIILPAQPTTFV